MKTMQSALKIAAAIILSLYGFTGFTQNAPPDFPVLEELVVLSDVENGYSHEVKIPSKFSDLTSYLGISATIANNGNNLCRVEGFFNGRRWHNSVVFLAPGEMKTLEILFKRMHERGTENFPAMSGVPGGSLFLWDLPDPSKAEKVEFMVFVKGKSSITISEIKPYGEFTEPEKIAARDGFFPFIDEFGQYKHAEWPGKIKSVADMRESFERESQELMMIPEPARRNQFGGWLDGPRLTATGHFRTEKVNGKWWLVDPEGYLYWSHGVTCVRPGNGSTGVSGREHFFEGLPSESDPLYRFFSQNDFNFTAANLYRKYGEDWEERNIIHTLKRMKSWGINSFGNWSDPAIFLYQENRIPYTMSVGGRSPRLDGHNKKFPDVFDPAFRNGLAEGIPRGAGESKDDPFCIGYYIDNELSVSDLTGSLMKQPAKGYSKQAFISYLKDKYGTIGKLNQSWGTDYSGWKSIEKLTELPAMAKGDAGDFDLVILEKYHQICRDELKKVAPDKLYLGSRLHCHYYPDDQTEVELIKIAARYCDVVTFNRYRFTAEDLILPEGVDRPVMIGEFHFGALDRGLFHTGLRSVANQQQRAEAYFHYVKGALNNPQMVGTHWFQYGDQAVTGRFDGENFQIGFVDLNDNPYPEIIEAARKIGYQMYDIRFED